MESNHLIDIPYEGTALPFSHITIGSGRGIRTPDLNLMRVPSYQTALSRNSKSIYRSIGIFLEEVNPYGFVILYSG